MPILIFILFFCVALALRAGALADPDTYWHLAAGDLIRDLDRLPETDPWSHTASGAPWYNISWAYDVALSFVHQLGGLPAVVVATIALYALAVALVGKAALASSRSIIAGAPVAILSGFVLLPGMLARPQSLTFLFVALFYVALRFARLRLLYVLPALTILWANVHGGFLAGAVVIGAFFLEAVIGREWPRARHLVIIGGLCVLGALINPYGWRIIEAADLTMTSVMKSVLAEWRPAAIGEANARTFFFAAFVLVSALFDRRIPVADRLLAVFWVAMGLVSARMMQVAAILAAPYIAQGLALRLGDLRVGASIAKKDAAYLADFARPGVRAALGGTALVLVAGAFAPPVQRALAAPESAFVEFPTSMAPSRAAVYLHTNYPDLRLYNEYGLGGFLIYSLRGEPRVFIDGRADTAFPRPLILDALAIGMMDRKNALDEEAWSALLRKYDIEGFFLSSRMDLYRVLEIRAGWIKVYEDERAALFVREDLAARPGLAAR